MNYMWISCPENGKITEIIFNMINFYFLNLSETLPLPRMTA